MIRSRANFCIGKFLVGEDRVPFGRLANVGGPALGREVVRVVGGDLVRLLLYDEADRLRQSAARNWRAARDVLATGNSPKRSDTHRTERKRDATSPARPDRATRRMRRRLRGLR